MGLGDERMGRRGVAVWNNRGELVVLVDMRRSVVGIEGGSYGRFWDQCTEGGGSSLLGCVIMRGVHKIDQQNRNIVNSKVRRD